MSISPHMAEALAHRRFSFGTSSAMRLPQLSSLAIRLIGSMRRGKKAATKFVRAEKCKGTGAFVSVDVIKAGALSLYLKPRGEVVDVLGHAKGNRN